MYSTPLSPSTAEEDRYNLVLNINRDVMHKSQPRQQFTIIGYNNQNNNASPSTSSSPGILAQQQHQQQQKYGSLQTVNSVSQLYARETESESINKEMSNIYFGLSSTDNNNANNQKNNYNNNGAATSTTTTMTNPVYNMPRRSEEYKIWYARRQKLRPSREEIELEEQLRCLADRRRRRTVMANRTERERLVREEEEEAEKRRKKQQQEDDAHRRAIADGSYLKSISNKNSTQTTTTTSSTGPRTATQILEAREQELQKLKKSSSAPFITPESLIYDSSTITSNNTSNAITPKTTTISNQYQQQETTNTDNKIITTNRRNKKYTFEDLSFDVKARIFEFLPIIPPYMLDDIRFICSFLPTDDALTLHEPNLAREAFDFVEECIHEHKDQFARASIVAIVIGLSDEFLQNAWKNEIGSAAGSGEKGNNNNSHHLRNNKSSGSAAAVSGVGLGGNSMFNSTSAAMLANNRLSRYLKMKVQEKQNRKTRLTRKLLSKEHQRQEIIQKQNQLKNLSQQQQQTIHANMKKRISEVYVRVDEMMKKLYAKEEEIATLRYPPDSSPYHCSVPHHQRELYGQMISIASAELKRQRQILNLCEKWIGFEQVAIATPCSVLRLILRECLDAWSNRIVERKNNNYNNAQLEEMDDDIDEEGDALIQEYEELDEKAQREADDDDEGGGASSNTKNSNNNNNNNKALLKSPTTTKQENSLSTSLSSSSPKTNPNLDGFKRIPVTSLPRFPQDINFSVRELLRANLDSMLRRVKAVEYVGAPTTEAEDIRDMLWDARSMHLPEGTTRDYGKSLTLGQIVSLGIAEVPWVRGFSWQDRTSCVVSRADIDITKMMALYPELETMRQLSLDKVVDTQKVIAERALEERRLMKEQRRQAEHERKMRVKRTATDALARRVWKAQPKSSSKEATTTSSSSGGSQQLPENPSVVLMQHHPFGSCEICSSIHVHQVGLKKPGSAVLGDIAVCENCYEEAFEGIPTIHKLYEWVAVRDVVDYDEKTMKYKRTNIHGEVEDDDDEENNTNNHETNSSSNDYDDDDQDDEFNQE